MGALCSKPPGPSRPTAALSTNLNLAAIPPAPVDAKKAKAVKDLFTQLETNLKSHDKSKFFILNMDQCLLPVLYV